MELETPDGCYFEHLTQEGNKELTHHMLLQYHTSWDWLMPVANKCFDTWYYEYDSDDLCFLLNNALLTTNINEVYRVVTEFINEHNKNK